MLFYIKTIQTKNNEGCSLRACGVQSVVLLYRKNLEGKTPAEVSRGKWEVLVYPMRRNALCY
jgi:hypothetical protein